MSSLELALPLGVLVVVVDGLSMPSAAVVQSRSHDMDLDLERDADPGHVCRSAWPCDVRRTCQRERARGDVRAVNGARRSVRFVTPSGGDPRSRSPSAALVRRPGPV
jgi:hypothetical protein